MPGARRGRATRKSQGRRRHLTVLFSDLSDSTRISEEMDPEHFAGLLAALRNVWRKVIPRHGGRIVSIQGDGVLAIFGYPKGREDDGRRATEAAIELHAAVSGLTVPGLNPSSFPLALHSGVHGGLVYLAPGDVERGRFAVGGEVSNTAAGLSAEAARGRIYVSEATLGPDANFFSVGERALVSIKGRSRPLQVCTILGRAEAQTRFQARSKRGLTPFVGRDAELRALRGHLREAMTGNPRCVIVSGGPGLGKTRLIEEAVQYAAEAQFRVLRGYCESYLGAEPMQPFMQMLRALGAAGGEARGAAAGGTIAALASQFEALAAERPLLLVVDDLQWADDASRQMLNAIRLLRRPILILVGSRGDAGDMPSADPISRIELGPLDAEASARSIAHLLPGVDPITVAEIRRYAGGVPLFIEELCHSAAADVDRRPVEKRLGGAAWVNALIESRVARLPHEQAEVISAAAVVGNVIPAWLLKRITGRDPEDPVVRALAEQDFLFPAEQAGTLRFKHGITRDVVYGTVGLHRRKAIHLSVAVALGEHYAGATVEEAYEALAYHYASAQSPADAAHYAELAGDKALASSALDLARSQYSAALSALDELAPLPREGLLRWSAIAQKLGMACVFDPLGLADGVALFERGVSLARQSGDPAALARAEYWLGYVCYAKGLPQKAKVYCEASLELSERIGDARLAAQARATLGQVLLSACDYDRALPLLDEVIESSRRKQAAAGRRSSSTAAYTIACKGCLLGDRGQFAEAQSCFEEALSLLERAPLQMGASVYGWIAAVYMWQGRWQDALQAADEASRIAESVRSRHLLAMDRALAGYSGWMLSGRAETLQEVRDSITWIEERKGSFLSSLCYGWLVDGAVTQGRMAEARRHAARLLLRARQHDRLGEAMGCRALARAAAMEGDFTRAERYLALAMRSAEARNSPHERAKTQLSRAEIELARGRRGEARKPLDAASEAFEKMKMPWFIERAAGLRTSL